MHQNTPKSKPPAAEEIKHLFYDTQDVQNPGVEYSPYFYVEARIDFNDVRTGFKSTVSLNKALEIYSIIPDLLWSEDMIRDIDPDKATSSLPDFGRLGALPNIVNAGFISQMEIQFVRYLLRSYKAKVYRNFELDMYSDSGESFSDFNLRCLDLLNESKRRELDSLQDVFNRRLEQIKQKYLQANASDDFELARTESRSRDIFFNHADRIANLFLQSDWNSRTNAAPVGQGNPELVERLLALELEAGQAIEKLQDSYKEKAQLVDEYILHPNLRDIHLVRSCILWIPAKVI